MSMKGKKIFWLDKLMLCYSLIDTDNLDLKQMTYFLKIYQLDIYQEEVNRKKLYISLQQLTKIYIQYTYKIKIRQLS